MRGKRPTIGIVGGLCPLAAADIYLKAMKHVRFPRNDADYPDIVISAALEQDARGNVFDPGPGHHYDLTHRMLYIYQVARDLRDRGVDHILVPGFLSYSFADTINASLGAPLLDIVSILAEAVREAWPEACRVGLLTTTSAREKNVFGPKFAAQGLELVFPDDAEQESLVMEADYGPEGVKRGVLSGPPERLMREACQHLLDKRADVVVSAITELPLIERSCFPEEHYLDCNEAIGRALATLAPSAPPAAKPKIIGVLGGMGPAATVDLFSKIVVNTPAECDQDHLKVVIENNPQIPDRTAALQGGSADPSVALLATAEKLQAAGADFIIVPCNTAHAFLEPLKEHLHVPLLNMIEETVRHIRRCYPDVRKAGLLATTGTINAGVYECELRKAGLKLLVPDPDSQENLVMRAIYGECGIKAGCVTGEPRELLARAAADLVSRGGQAMILGCTEIPLALPPESCDVPLIDATEILARAAVSQALGSSAPCS